MYKVADGVDCLESMQKQGMDEEQERLSHPELPEMPEESGPSSQCTTSSLKEKASSQANSTSTKKKGALKRKANPSGGGKVKKKKKTSVQRPSFTVEHGEDMLLIISNVNQYESVWKPKKKGSKKKKARSKATSVKKVSTIPKVTKSTEPTSVSAVESDEDKSFNWGHNLPIEVLVKIFELIVLQDGAVPFLCRVGRVCRLWNSAASSSMLWQRVTMGYCWTEPGGKQLPKTEQKIRNTVEWLAENRFSQLRDFKLCHWKKNVDFVVQTISRSCPNLQSLELSDCMGVTKQAFQSLETSCQSLESINMQHTEFQDDGLRSFLESCGNQLKKLLFTHSSKSDKLLNLLYRGCCPNLRMLDINIKLNSGYCQLPICITALQLGCPGLQTFRLMNISPVPKTIRNTPSSTSGFPMLEELSIASSSHSSLSNNDLHKILHGSTNLRVLDLRGCSRVTGSGLVALPCKDLECLYWGLYFNSNAMVASNKGIYLVTDKWSHSLRELDLTNQPFSELEMELAVQKLAKGPGTPSLRSLNLSGTTVPSNAIRLLVAHCTSLEYLNLSSCRYLPRGLKRVYRGQDDIHQLLDKLVLLKD